MTILKSIVREILVVTIAAAVGTATFALVLPWYSNWHHRQAAKSALKGEATGAISVGDKVQLQGLVPSNSKLSVILITSPSCRFCLASRPFHSRLSREALTRHIPFFVAVPSVRDAEEYVNSAKIVGEIKPWSDLGFKIRGTPTLVLVDSSGIAKAVLSGQLPTDLEDDVVNSLDNPRILLKRASAEPERVITSGDLPALGRREHVVLIDVSEREEYRARHRQGAVNIPLAELPIRAHFELGRGASAVIDCTRFASALCKSIIQNLARDGVQAKALADGTVVNSCSVGAITR